MFALSGAAGGAADALDQIIKQKFLEMRQRQLVAQQQAELAENARQANQRDVLGHGNLDVSRGNLKLGTDKLTEDARQFNVEQPIRGRLQSAQAAELARKPQAEQQERDFTTSRDKSTQDFTTVRDRTQHGYQMGEIGARNAGDLEVARLRGSGSANDAQAQNEVLDSIALIDQMAGDKALSAYVGPVDQYGTGNLRDLSGVNRYKALHEQLAGKLALAQAGKLKGQGQISDKERALLSQAATALKRGLTEEDYRAELAKIRSQFERMNTGAPISTAKPSGGKPDAAKRAADLLKKYGG